MNHESESAEQSTAQSESTSDSPKPQPSGSLAARARDILLLKLLDRAIITTQRVGDARPRWLCIYCGEWSAIKGELITHEAGCPLAGVDLAQAAAGVNDEEAAGWLAAHDHKVKEDAGQALIDSILNKIPPLDTGEYVDLARGWIERRVVEAAQPLLEGFRLRMLTGLIYTGTLSAYSRGDRQLSSCLVCGQSCYEDDPAGIIHRPACPGHPDFFHPDLIIARMKVAHAARHSSSQQAQASDG